MDRTEAVLEGARRIRHFLPQLLEAETATGMDQELARLLAQARQGEKVDNAILLVVARERSTRAWMQAFLELEDPARGLKGGEALPGHPSPVNADRFVCPEDDYVWCRHSVGEPVPLCPTHGVALVRAGQC